MTSLEYTNSIEGLVNDFVNGASDEKEFKVGILDVLIKARDDFFGKTPKPATKEMINFLLVNALRLLSKEQQRILAKEISDRASEVGVQPEVIASEHTEGSSANGAVADIGKTFILNTDEGKLALSQEDILNTIDADLDMMDNGDLMSWEVMRKDMTEKEINELPASLRNAPQQGWMASTYGTDCKCYEQKI